MKRRDFLKSSIVVGGAVSMGCGTGSSLSDLHPDVRTESGRGSISAFDLRCESVPTPLGMDVQRPRLSWKLKALENVRNQTQSAYRITVASTEALLLANQPDLWDTGKVKSAAQLHIEYRGKPLVSRRRYYWQVVVWDNSDRRSTPGPASWWEMGLLSENDWTGSWISDGKNLPVDEEQFYEDDPAPLFRKRFRIEQPILRARLYAAGLGYHEHRINGEPVSDHVLEPAWTSFGSRVFYTTHDVTDQLSQGENVLGVMLGNGWFNPLPLRMWGRINLRDHLAIGRPQLKTQLVIDFTDGSTQTVSSDPTWKVTEGPVLRNSVYLGELYDARRELPGWDQPGFDDSDWRPAASVYKDQPDNQPGELQASPIPPIRVTKRLAATSVNEVEPGVFIFDMGQNFAGWAKLRVQGPRGTTVRMRMGERLYPDGTLNPMTAVAGQIKGLKQDGTPRGGPGAPEIAWQLNEYTLRGDANEREEYTPKFTFHGFRYVEVAGFPGRPALDSIEGLRLNTDVPIAGSFSCSNDRLNSIHEMVQWTFLSNLFSVQSDCPAREKFQYGGDIVASSEMAIFGYDMSTMYAKIVADHRDAIRRDGWLTETAPYVGISAENYAVDAGPIGWGLAHPLLVAQLYQYYGDLRIVEENYETARTWVGLLAENAEGYIIDRCIGDHESLDPKPIELIATAHFFQAANLVAEFADALGRPKEVVYYQKLATNIRQAFIDRFLEFGTGRFGTGTQAAQATALVMGLSPSQEVDAVVRQMVSEVQVTHGGHVATGIFGTKYLLSALSKSGHSDVAYQMVDTPTFPGWGFMLEQGATTLWETWAESDNVYSQNHPMFGSVSEWFYKWLGGIQPQESAVGFDRFLIEPCIPVGLQWVEASYTSVRGTIRSKWRLENDLLVAELEIPVNTTATLQLPTREKESLREGINGADVSPDIRRLPSTRPGSVRVQLGSGRYTFTVAAP